MAEENTAARWLINLIWWKLDFQRGWWWVIKSRYVPRLQDGWKEVKLEEDTTARLVQISQSNLGSNW